MLNGSELGSFATGISKAKKALDTYCKSLKEKEVASKSAPAQPATTAPAPVATNKVEEKPNIVFTPKNNVRPQFNRNQPDSRGNNNNPRFNRDGSRPPFNRNNGDRPMGQRPAGGRVASNGQQGQNRPFKPFVKEEKEVLFVKPEREFGNKNKTKQVNDEKKELSKKAKIKVPKSKLKAYKKLFNKKGQSKSAKISK